MRSTYIERNTKETQISILLNLDGGDINVETGIGFFDHMMIAFATHAGFGLQLKVKGDLEVDCHHTIEDTGIVLGQAFANLLVDKKGINRFGSFNVVMDEALAQCDLDFSGRGILVFNATFMQEKVGQYDSCMTEEFFRALAVNGGITLHINVPYGKNSHHQIEAIFKAVGHAMAIGTTLNESGKLLSTKGML